MLALVQGASGAEVPDTIWEPPLEGDYLEQAPEGLLGDPEPGGSDPDRRGSDGPGLEEPAGGAESLP